MSLHPTQDILDIVNQWESSDKSDFIKELLLDVLTVEQRLHILHCLQYNTPLKGDGR